MAIKDVQKSFRKAQSSEQSGPAPAWLKQIADEIVKTGATRFNGKPVSADALILRGQSTLNKGWSPLEALENMFNYATNDYENGLNGMEKNDAYWKVNDLRNQYMAKTAASSDQYSKNFSSMNPNYGNKQVLYRDPNTGYGIGLMNSTNRSGYTGEKVSFLAPDGTPLNSFTTAQDQEILQAAEKYGMNLDTVRQTLGGNERIGAELDRRFPAGVPGRPTGEYYNPRTTEAYTGADVDIPMNPNYVPPRGLQRGAYGLDRYSGPGYVGNPVASVFAPQNPVSNEFGKAILGRILNQDSIQKIFGG